jgi:hypothetical protein
MDAHDYTTNTVYKEFIEMKIRKKGTTECRG